jgi:hypothetical protein
MRPTATTGAVMVSLTREIVWDCTMVETYGLRADVTDLEVEDGSSISDHVRLHQPDLQLEVIATTTPLNGLEPGAERDREIRRTLQEMWENIELIYVIGESVEGDNYIITSIDESTDRSSGEACNPRISLKRVRFATRQLVAVPPLPVVQRRVSQTVDTGAQATSSTDSADVNGALGDTNGSLLYNVSGETDAEVLETVSSGSAALERGQELMGGFFGL